MSQSSGVTTEPQQLKRPDERRNDTQGQVEEKRDPRAIIVAVVGLSVILLVAVVGFLLLPGSVPSDEVNTKGQNIVSIASAAITAVGAIIAAYFGVKAANVAREDSAKASERHEARTAGLAAMVPKEDAQSATDLGAQQLERLRG
jgi:hypothetical protein